MPKKVKYGVGMMERTRLRYDLTDAGGEDEWTACIEHMMRTMVGPDEGRDRIAAGFRAILTARGLPDPGVAALNDTVYGQQGEDSVQYIAAQWLMEYNRLNRERNDLASGSKAFDLQLMIMHAEELGRLQERCQWRHRIDEATGKRPEELALSGRRQVKNGQDGNAMRSDNSFLAKNGKRAQQFVNELHIRKPHLSWADLQRKAAESFGVSAITIKRNLSNPKKAGSGRSE